MRYACLFACCLVSVGCMGVPSDDKIEDTSGELRASEVTVPDGSLGPPSALTGGDPRPEPIVVGIAVISCGDDESIVSSRDSAVSACCNAVDGCELQYEHEYHQNCSAWLCDCLDTSVGVYDQCMDVATGP